MSHVTHPQTAPAHACVFAALQILKKRTALLAFLSLLPLVPALHAAETETLYLSGKGKDDMVQWDFICNAGMKANIPSKIGVPSNWELQGFGIYTYGRPVPQGGWPKVQGKYKRTFTLPANWADKSIFIVFEGVMTDAQVKINGLDVGPMHQGGYYQFRYDITFPLKQKPPGAENEIEVTVDDESANQSVNNAERRGDYWNYAGIFRPVYLEALPRPLAIEHLAIDARADGSISVDVSSRMTGGLRAEERPPELQLRVLDLTGKPVGTLARAGEGGTHFEGKIASPFLWTAETPSLYQLEARIVQGETEIHTVRQKFGFRTIEVRPGEGLFVNGSRIMLKGADRHSFWPDSGRCLSEAVSRGDIALMKEMNMNAVRMSHYPPDAHFLDACDEMGMYVLDELAGWHAAYDTPTGKRLVQEMVTRDVNHPSILFWDNGNEGGWNTAVDGDFAQWDPQKRLVIHPQQTQAAKGLDNSHYPQYNAVVTKSAGNNVFFPTEMLHGLYDGGHGAGLEDYWRVMMASKVSAGGFLWVLADESLKRTDKGGILDSAGNQGPDGIVGPYREKEGSFYTIKQIWSPIVLQEAPEFHGINVGQNFVTSIANVKFENRFDFIDAQQCGFTWQIRKLRSPAEVGAGGEVLASGVAKPIGSVPPHSSGSLAFDNPPSLTTKLSPNEDEIMTITAQGPDKREIMTWSYPLHVESHRLLVSAPTTAKLAFTETSDALTATAGDLSLQFNKKTGFLAAASRAGKNFSLVNGPRFLTTPSPTPAPARGGTAPAPAALPDSTLASITQKPDGADLLITATYDGPMKSTVYRLRPNGWLTIDYVYSLAGPRQYFGVGFDYPEANVKGMRYLGNGPSTVLQNRLAGGTLDVWEKKYNNTQVGAPEDLKPDEHFDYPIFKGYYNGVRWLQLQTTEGPITALINQDNLFVQVLTPKTPPAGANGVAQAGVPFPNAGISFLHAIPAIGSKFTNATTTGPMGQPAVANGDNYQGSISLYFGDLH